MKKSRVERAKFLANLAEQYQQPARRRIEVAYVPNQCCQSECVRISYSDYPHEYTCDAQEAEHVRDAAKCLSAFVLTGDLEMMADKWEEWDGDHEQ